MRGWLIDNIATVDVSGSKVEWSVVPFPTGDDATSTVVPGIIDGWGCVSSSENPQGVINWIIMQKMFNVEHNSGEGYENLVKCFGDKQYSNGQEYLDVIKQYKEFTVARFIRV